MFTKNPFNKKDEVADMIGNILEADYKVKKEELKGNQHKIDMNKNNKVDAHDFKLLRGEKKGMKKEEAEQIDEEINVKKDYDDHEQSEHGVYKGKRKIGYIVHDKKAGTHTAYHGHKYGKDDYENSDDFKSHEHALNQIKKSSGINESNNPFDLKNYKSQLPTKPGEKAGFDSKKVSTGTIYSRKPVKDEPMKKEEIDPNDTTTDTLKGREKTSGNPFLSKKVKMDVPDNVKEEVEQIDELSSSTIDSYRKKLGAKIDTTRTTRPSLQAAIKAKNAPIQAKIHNALMKQHQAIRRERGMSEGVAEGNNSSPYNQMDDLKSKSNRELEKSIQFWNNALEKNPEHKVAREQLGLIKMIRAERIGKKGVTEEVEQIDERELSKGETKEKERIVKGMKKSLSGFKQRYGDRAKSVMYATATKAAKKD